MSEKLRRRMIEDMAVRNWERQEFWVRDKMLDMPDTPASTLTTARDIARKVGLHFVYTGNIRDEMGQSTYCPCCGERIIGRDWYDITIWRLAGDGRCGICSTAIPGLFEPRPGHWGQRRVPIRIGRREHA